MFDDSTVGNELAVANYELFLGQKIKTNKQTNTISRIKKQNKTPKPTHQNESVMLTAVRRQMNTYFSREDNDDQKGFVISLRLPSKLGSRGRMH